MLYFIGIGLADERDISLRGLEVIEKCKKVYLESYTSKLQCDVKALEKLYDKKVVLADRKLVEREADTILDDAVDSDVAFLVIGDSMGATTHTDLMLRAREKKIKFEVIFNASVLNAVGIVGLELYKYGKTTSIPFPTKSYKPETAYDVIKMNSSMGLHTLVLLDVKPPKFMTVNQGISELLKIEDKRKEKVFNEDTLVVGCARLGAKDFVIKSGSVQDIVDLDFGKPLHCLIVVGKLHFMEEDALKMWK